MKLGPDGDVHVIFGVLSSLPDLKPTQTVVTRILATIPAARETLDGARGAKGSTALCQSADAGSNPAGSILPSVEKIYTGERTQR